MRRRGADKELSPRMGADASRDRPRLGGRVMPHPLVDQLRFARSEFQRALEGLTDDDARRRFVLMNCISWNIGHLAWQEQRYWLWRGQDQILLPHINDQFAYGAPASTP